MPRKFLSGIDLVQQQIINARLHQSAGSPSSPVAGQIWYDTGTNRFVYQDNVGAKPLVRDGGDLTAGSVANAALATNPLARANHTGTQAAATISDLATVVQAYRLDQFAAPNAPVAFGSQRITGLADPQNAQDAATKNYVDGAIAGLTWKEEVRVATTAAGTLSTSFANGQTVDGITLATNDRILIKNQAAAAENGIYIVTAGTPTRATDADSATDIIGAAVYVTNGTTNGGQRYVNTNTGAISLGTTGITWAQFGGGSTYTNGNGLSLTGNVFAVVPGNGILADGSSTRVDPSVVVRKYAATIGNGALTSIAVAHNLGSQDITYSVRQVSDNAFVECDAVATDTNTLTLTFGTAPANNSLRVVVHV